MRRRGWPDWWDWELELSPHLLKRMTDRGLDRERQLLVVVTAYPVWE